MKSKNYKDFIIKKGDYELGILWSDIKHCLLTPEEYKKFSEWMQGQTCSMLDHVSDDGKEKHYLPLVYVDDFERFIKGKPVID